MQNILAMFAKSPRKEHGLNSINKKAGQMTQNLLQGRCLALLCQQDQFSLLANGKFWMLGDCFAVWLKHSVFLMRLGCRKRLRGKR